MHEQVFNLIKNLHRVDEIGSAYTKVPIGRIKKGRVVLRIKPV